MEIKPVKDIEKPKYPLKDEVDIKKLKDSVPERWTGSRAAKVALAALAAASLTGCAPDDFRTAGVPLPPSLTSEGACLTNTNEITTDYVPEGTVAPAMINVSPLFSHGNGRGSFGCDMVTSPAFISEDEALSIINETAKEYGLSFSAVDTPEFSNVQQPVTNLSTDDTLSAKPSGQGKVTSLKSDFANSKHGVVIEFVSVDDVKQWSDAGSGGTVEEYRTKDAAEQLSEALEQAYAGNGSSYTASVLYDPCEMYLPENISEKTDWDEVRQKTKKMTEEQLKAQAKDLFDWLKSQGII